MEDGTIVVGASEAPSPKGVKAAGVAFVIETKTTTPSPDEKTAPDEPKPEAADPENTNPGDSIDGARINGTDSGGCSVAPSPGQSAGESLLSCLLAILLLRRKHRMRECDH